MADSHESSLRIVIAVVITVAWAVSFIVGIIRVDYNPPATVGALMLMVAGALFGENILRKGEKEIRRMVNGKKVNDDEG